MMSMLGGLGGVEDDVVMDVGDGFVDNGRVWRI